MMILQNVLNKLTKFLYLMAFVAFNLQAASPVSPTPTPASTGLKPAVFAIVQAGAVAAGISPANFNSYINLVKEDYAQYNQKQTYQDVVGQINSYITEQKINLDRILTIINDPNFPTTGLISADLATVLKIMFGNTASGLTIDSPIPSVLKYINLVNETLIDYNQSTSSAVELVNEIVAKISPNFKVSDVIAAISQPGFPGDTAFDQLTIFSNVITINPSASPTNLPGILKNAQDIYKSSNNVEYKLMQAMMEQDPTLTFTTVLTAEDQLFTGISSTIKYKLLDIAANTANLPAGVPTDMFSATKLAINAFNSGQITTTNIDTPLAVQTALANQAKIDLKVQQSDITSQGDANAFGQVVTEIIEYSKEDVNQAIAQAVSNLTRMAPSTSKGAEPVDLPLQSNLEELISLDNKYQINVSNSDTYLQLLNSVQSQNPGYTADMAAAKLSMLNTTTLKLNDLITAVKGLSLPSSIGELDILSKFNYTVQALKSNPTTKVTDIATISSEVQSEIQANNNSKESSNGAINADVLYPGDFPSQAPAFKDIYNMDGGFTNQNIIKYAMSNGISKEQLETQIAAVEAYITELQQEDADGSKAAQISELQQQVSAAEEAAPEIVD